MSQSDLDHKQKNQKKGKSNIFDLNPKYSFKSSGNILQIPCYYHSGKTITNFCTDFNCLMPLCPLCIEIHQNEQIGRMHVGNFEPIEGVHSRAIQLAEQLLAEQNICEQQIKDLGKTAQQNEQEILQLVEIKEKQLIDLIHSYFHEVKYNIKAAFSNYSDSDIEKEVKHAKNELEHIEKHLKKSRKHLDKPKKLLPELINVFQPNYIPQIRQDISDIQVRLQFLAARLPQVEVNDLYLQNIQADLMNQPASFCLNYNLQTIDIQSPLFGKHSFKQSNQAYFPSQVNSKNFKQQFASILPVRASGFAATQRSFMPTTIYLNRKGLISMSPSRRLQTTQPSNILRNSIRFL